MTSLHQQPAFSDPVQTGEAVNADSGNRDTHLRTQKALLEEGSALQKYQRLVSGTNGIPGLLKYELITGLFGGLPGVLGLALRRFFYRFLFKKMGRGVIIGRHVTIRHPQRIELGNQVVIEDGVVLDAKGDAGDMVIEDQVFIGRGTILTCRSGPLRIEAGSSISSYCRIGSGRIGRKVLIAAYVYLITGGHRTDRWDMPVIDQPAEFKGGVEIGDCCWIGAFCGVMDGVRIGHNSLIGAHSLVTRDIPPYSIAVGVPAEVKRDRRAAQ
jgi:acetyltransferase-like isoleucine patch superfamily enzyme